MSIRIHDISDMDNLRMAYLKSRRGKQMRPEAMAFGGNVEANLLELRSQILSGCLNVGKYKLFHVHDPKERLICASPFSERVLHHAIMNICENDFELCQIDVSFACRKGKGSHSAINHAFELSKSHSWYLKLDVRHYFETVPHSILKEKLDMLFCDSELLNLFEQIIASYERTPGRGLPIGNLTSQYFANYYLSFADRFLTEKLGFCAYSRYMDDMILWGNDKNILLDSVGSIKEYFRDILSLELKPICLNRTSYGLPYLGHLIYHDRILLNRRSRKRYEGRLEQGYYYLTLGYWNQDDFFRHIGPVIAFTEKSDSKEFRKKIQQRFGRLSQVRTA